MRALVYLEYRYACHRFAAIARAPIRLAIWIPYALFVALLFLTRGSNAQHAHPAAAISPQIATLVGGVYLAALGLSIASAASGRITAFRTPAEAVLLSNAGIAPLTVAVWLHGRRLASSWTGWIGSVAYLCVIFSPADVGAATTARAAAGALLVLAVRMSVELPVFLLARRRFAAQFRAGGYALVAVGLAYLALGAFGGDVRTPVLAAVHADPGTVVAAILRGDPLPLAAGIATLAALFAATRLLGDDAMPELYAATLLGPAALRARALSARASFAGTGGRAARIPAGAGALIWKDWISFRRARGVLALYIAGCAFWASCGAGAAYATIRFDDAAPLVTLATITLLLLLGTPTVAAFGLAADLSKPIFWLSSARLRTRLAAWTFGRAWRGGIALALAPLVAGLVLGQPAVALAAVLAALAAAWSLQSLGVGLVALFPDPIDTRGPMMLLRIFVTLAYVAPAALAGTGVLFATGFGIAPFALAVAVALAVEGWVVIEFAALRFEEHGAALATLARAT